MPEERELEKQLKVAAKTGKYVVGRREILGGVKGSKLLVWSASANVPQQILDECKTLSVPAVKFNGNPVELGHACGIPFRVSVIAVKSAGDADLRGFSNSSDYISYSQVVISSEEKERTQEPSKKEQAISGKSSKRTLKKKVAKEEETEPKSEKPKSKRKKSKDEDKDV